MKIVFANDLIYAYATNAPSAIGGAERQQWLLAHGLAAAGWDVAIGVRTGLAFNQRAHIEGVEFVGIGQKQFLLAWYGFIISERPDWCYWRCATHLLGPILGIAKMRGVRSIFSVAFDRDVDIRHALFLRPRWWPLYALGLFLSDRIFVQNEKQLSDLPPKLRTKASVVPSITVETQTWKPHAVRAKYVAWVAMFRQSKRPDVLVEIARKAPDIRFVVCGGPTSYTAAPDYGEQIANALRNLPNVEYRGQVSPDEATRIIADAAVFLSTADEEGFPNTFLQAWATGTPVITLRVDPDRVIERYRMGKRSLSVEQAIDDLRVLLDSDEEREAISARSRAYIAKNHSAPAVIKIFEHGIRCAIREPALQSHSGRAI